MRKWIAGLLMVILLCSCGLAAAQEAPAADDAGIQEEAVQPRETGDDESLAEYHEALMDLLNDEDVQKLLQIEDVRELIREGAVAVLAWMIQNRPVTMEILVEFGVGECDRRCVDKIWDSADRIAEAWRDYSATEDGQALVAELEALCNDPEIIASGNEFLMMVTSDDIAAIMDSIWRIVEEGAAAEHTETSVTEEAIERQLDRSTFIGELVVELLSFCEQSEWARDSLPALLENDNLTRVLIHLSEDSAFYDVVQEECRVLAEDPELMAFIERTLQDGVALIQMIWDESDPFVLTNANDAISEEAAP